MYIYLFIYIYIFTAEEGGFLSEAFKTVDFSLTIFFTLDLIVNLAAHLGRGNNSVRCIFVYLE